MPQDVHCGICLPKMPVTGTGIRHRYLSRKDTGGVPTPWRGRRRTPVYSFCCSDASIATVRGLVPVPQLHRSALKKPKRHRRSCFALIISRHASRNIAPHRGEGILWWVVSLHTACAAAVFSSLAAHPTPSKSQL